MMSSCDGRQTLSIRARRDYCTRRLTTNQIEVITVGFEKKK